MLSIGKLAVGQADYYLEQAQGPVTRAGAVSSGVEDYYLGGPEAAGAWVGAGSRALGLSGPVGARELERVLSGVHPASGEPLGRPRAARVPGFDLTFSAPKSVSLLFGIGDNDLRRAVRDAHDRAVQDTLGYLERHATVTRRGAGGARAIRGNGFIAAAFRHRTSRAGDPQLHTHVLIANQVLGADGRWSTLDGRRIYAHAKTAGYLYEARLRALLTRELGVEWSPVRNGIADVAGVSPKVMRAFSRRRADIEAELERRDASSAAAAQVAALATRRAKDYRVTPEALVPEWRKRAAELRLDARAVRALIERSGAARPEPWQLGRLADRLGGSTGLTRRRSTFTRRDVVQAWCELLPAGSDVSVSDVERLADDFLASPRAVVLAARPGPADSLRRRDGRLVAAAPAELHYSTPELLALERHVLDYALAPPGRPLGVAEKRDAKRAIRRRPSIAGEQAEMVTQLTQDGAAVSVVVGEAGTGKTFALAAAREAWEASGCSVVGAAVAQRAARELALAAGIKAMTLAGLLHELRLGAVPVLPRGGVLVIDEAGMVATRGLAEVVEHASHTGTELVLVGDHRQLPALEAGGAFRALALRLPAIELRENRRQQAAWERDALRLLRGGAAEEAVARYEQHGRVVVGEHAAELRERLVADWWAARDPDGALMIAHRRVDVADLNGRARALMRACGALGAADVGVAGRRFAVGDRVVLRRNDRACGAVNGDRGVVVGVDGHAGSIDVRVAGRELHLDRYYLECAARDGSAAVLHGYAVTGHVAQGATCHRTFVLATDRLTAEWGYTALSRGRETNHLYVMASAADDRAEYAPTIERSPDVRRALIEGLQRSEAQTLASETGVPSATEPELKRVVADRPTLEAAHAVAWAELARTREAHIGPWRPLDRRRQAAALHRLAAEEAAARRAVELIRAREERLRLLLEAEQAPAQGRRDVGRKPGRSAADRRMGIER